MLRLLNIKSYICLLLCTVMQEWTGGARVSNQQPSQQDFLEEPSPLGLRLKKSPSLVDFIQMKLAQASKATDARHGSNCGASEKLKASNFPGSVLRIGSWEVSVIFYMFWLHFLTLLIFAKEILPGLSICTG
jgi:hypothetical protein